jgi:hypothetical protein
METTKTKRKGEPMKTSSLLVEDFPVELRKNLKIRALLEDTTLKELIVRVLTEYLKKE